METKGGLGDNKEGKQTLPLQGRHRMDNLNWAQAAVNDISITAKIAWKSYGSQCGSGTSKDI